MNITVTGAAGYLGSVLVPLLMERGHNVKAVDKFFFGTNQLDEEKEEGLQIINADTRTFDPFLLNGADAVIDLAAVAQTDPEGILPPALFYDMNFIGSSRVANLSRLAGVKKYIYASTTSIYGIREDAAFENSVVNPTEIYAKTKYLAEQSILALNSEDFSVTALRLATLYGRSPRMRFDLLLNRLILSAYRDRKILIGGRGMQQRVILHVKDAADAFLIVLNAPPEKAGGNIFNVGTNDQNFRIIDLARAVHSIFPDSEYVYYDDPDNRSFHVNFDKAERLLRFKAKLTPSDAAAELREDFGNGLLPEARHFVVPWWLTLCKEGKIWPA